MKETLRLVVAAAVLVASVSMVAVAPAAAQSDGGISLEAEADDATPGGNVTVSFSVENTGEPTGMTLSISQIPDGWEVQGHQDANATSWNSNTNTWLWLTVNANETVEPSVTMAVPDDASGEYTVGANASTNQMSTETETTITVGSGTDTEAGTSGGSGPGFGVAVTLVALLAVALLARRQG